MDAHCRMSALQDALKDWRDKAGTIWNAITGINEIRRDKLGDLLSRIGRVCFRSTSVKADGL